MGDDLMGHVWTDPGPAVWCKVCGQQYSTAYEGEGCSLRLDRAHGDHGVEVDELAEAIHSYLRLYMLPANVREYLSPDDTHDTVAARCAPMIAEHVRTYADE